MNYLKAIGLFVLPLMLFNSPLWCMKRSYIEIEDSISIQKEPERTISVAMNMLKVVRETFSVPSKKEKKSYKLLQRVMFSNNDVLEALLTKFFK